MFWALFAFSSVTRISFSSISASSMALMSSSSRRIRSRYFSITSATLQQQQFYNLLQDDPGQPTLETIKILTHIIGAILYPGQSRLASQNKRWWDKLTQYRHWPPSIPDQSSLWGTGIRGLMRGMATFPQANQELLVIRTKLEDPRVSWGKQLHGMWYFSLQCFDTVGWAIGRASGL